MNVLVNSFDKIESDGRFGQSIHDPILSMIMHSPTFISRRFEGHFDEPVVPDSPVFGNVDNLRLLRFAHFAPETPLGDVTATTILRRHRISSQQKMVVVQGTHPALSSLSEVTRIFGHRRIQTVKMPVQVAIVARDDAAAFPIRSGLVALIAGDEIAFGISDPA